MQLLFSLLLLFSPPSVAGECSEVAVSRMESAARLMEEAADTDAVDRASVVERARILLERTLEDDPGCASARKMKRKADRLLREVTPISEAASLEDALLHALERVEAVEQAEEVDPAELEAVRFMLAVLADRMPSDPRVEALVKRAWAVGGGK